MPGDDFNCLEEENCSSPLKGKEGAFLPEIKDSKYLPDESSFHEPGLRQVGSGEKIRVRRNGHRKRGEEAA